MEPPKNRVEFLYKKTSAAFGVKTHNNLGQHQQEQLSNWNQFSTRIKAAK
jgi:hypothetical protein